MRRLPKESAYYRGYSAELLVIADQMKHPPMIEAYHKMAKDYLWMASCLERLEARAEERKAAADAAAAG